MDENNSSQNISPQPENGPSLDPTPPDQKPVIAQSDQQSSNFGRTIKQVVIVISCIFLIGSLYIFSMLLATIFGPHSSCGKWGCTPTTEAVIIYGLGSLLISVPLSIKILKSAFKK